MQGRLGVNGLPGMAGKLGERASLDRLLPLHSGFCSYIGGDSGFDGLPGLVGMKGQYLRC